MNTRPRAEHDKDYRPQTGKEYHESMAQYHRERAEHHRQEHAASPGSQKPPPRQQYKEDPKTEERIPIARKVKQSKHQIAESEHNAAANLHNWAAAAHEGKGVKGYSKEEHVTRANEQTRIAGIASETAKTMDKHKKKPAPTEKSMQPAGTKPKDPIMKKKAEDKGISDKRSPDRKSTRLNSSHN